MTHELFMKRAIKEAIKAASRQEVPIGAVIVMNDRIISHGYNQVEQLTDSTAHAEIIALTSAFNHLGAKYLPEATLYVTIEPCMMCAGALYWSKIGRIVYGADDEKNGYRKFIKDSVSVEVMTGNKKIPALTPFHPKTEVVKGVCHEECRALMQKFFKSRR